MSWLKRTAPSRAEPEFTKYLSDGKSLPRRVCKASAQDARSLTILKVCSQFGSRNGSGCNPQVDLFGSELLFCTVGYLTRRKGLQSALKGSPDCHRAVTCVLLTRYKGELPTAGRSSLPSELLPACLLRSGSSRRALADCPNC